MGDYIASIDQGTTSTRCIIFNHKGEPVGSHQLEHEQLFPKPGWVEHNPEEIWARTQDVIRESMKLAGAQPEDIAAIGVTNQRETTVVWDKVSGKDCITMPSSGRTPARTPSLLSWAKGWRAGSLQRPRRVAAGHLFLRSLRSSGS